MSSTWNSSLNRTGPAVNLNPEGPTQGVPQQEAVNMPPHLRPFLVPELDQPLLPEETRRVVGTLGVLFHRSPPPDLPILGPVGEADGIGEKDRSSIGS